MHPNRSFYAMQREMSGEGKAKQSYNNHDDDCVSGNNRSNSQNRRENKDSMLETLSKIVFPNLSHPCTKSQNPLSFSRKDTELEVVWCGGSGILVEL